MPLDAAALTASLRAELARDFPEASPEELDLALRSACGVLEEAKVQTFLPILAAREARRVLAARGTPPRAQPAERDVIVLPDERETVASVG